MKKFMFVACAVLCLAACKKDNDEKKPGGEQEEVVAFTLTGTLTEAIDGISSSWADDAQISAFVGYNSTTHQLNVPYAATSVDGTKATFETKVKKVEEQSNYVAVYPYATANTLNAEAGTVEITLPATQTYVAGGVTPTALPLVSSSTTKDLQFKQVCGVFRIALKGNVTVNAIEVEAAGITGAASVDPASAAVTMSDNAGDKITYNITTPAALAETATVFNVVLPPATYETVYYTVYAADGSQMSAFDENVTITRAAVTNAAATEYIADGSIPDATNLSEEGYANCYVVNAPGNYVFECVIPNAKKTIAEGTEAKWVWATSGTWASQEEASAEMMVTDIAYDADKNTISFTVPEDFTYGNVLIALLDKDGLIQYGWHIWLTSKINTLTVAGVEIMDRNLGAGGVLDVTSTDEAFINNTPGLTYQWGRKDAFPGPRGYLSAHETVVFNPGTTAYSVTNSGIKNVTAYPAEGADNPWTFANYTHDENLNTTIEAGQHPCTNINNTPTGGGDTFPGFGNNEWAAEANPCPYGYGLIKEAQVRALFAEEIANEIVKNEKNEFCAATIVDKTLVIPHAAFRNSGKAQKPTDIRIWAFDHTSSTAAHGVWAQIGSGTGYVHGLKYGNANEIHSAFVRCVKQ